ncbi:MAG: orotate phosphoribosyltransferase [Acidimicrobiia bacterium]|nr:orotate phosphoribosyltransferase [Acidimicrobiia bacterium]
MPPAAPRPSGDADLAERLRTVALLRGSFVLRGGEVADTYFDKYRFASDPALLSEVADGLAALVPEDTDLLAGLELGGIAIVTALSARTGLPAVFVRKAAKPYGTAHLIEGRTVKDQRTLVVEDVVTSGGQVSTSTLQLRDAGAIVDAAVCVIDRGVGGAEALADMDVELRSLFTAADLAAGGDPPGG